MNLFVRGVVYGFALSLGAALFKRVQGQLGLAEEQPSGNGQPATAPDDGGNDDGGDAALAPA